VRLSVRKSVLAGDIAVPGSKSHTIRGIVAALASDGECVLHSPLYSADTLSTLAAAGAFGAEVREEKDCWVIRGRGKVFKDPGKVVDMGNSGLGTRLLTGFASLQDFEVSFTGDASLCSRPMGPMLDSYRQLGVKIGSANGYLPFSVRGPLAGGRCTADGADSQYLSSLLFALPLAESDSEVDLAFLNEKPYVGITARWLDELGIKYTASDDMLHWHIPGGQRIAPFEKQVPADFSTACFPLAAALVSGGKLKIKHLDFSDAQGDKAVFGFAEAMGAVIEHGADGVTVRLSSSGLTGGEFDLDATPDALPVLAVLGAYAHGETRLINVPQARHKECDRIAVMAAELRKLGVDTEELPDGLIVRGGGLCGGTVDSHGDHRIAMAFAVAGMGLDEGIAITNAGVAAVTYPDFVADFKAIGADMRETD